MIEHEIGFYKRGYKYQLIQSCSYAVTGFPDVPVSQFELNLFVFIESQVLFIRSGYCWDGPSGPVRDGNKLMRASLVHDALYQLMRERSLPDTERDKADRLFQQMLVEDGVSKLRAWVYYRGLKAFGKRAATKQRKVYEL